ncbi:MAG: hypothetical protein AAF718_11215 [Pseudomonadota bacterium]
MRPARGDNIRQLEFIDGRLFAVTDVALLRQDVSNETRFDLTFTLPAGDRNWRMVSTEYGVFLAGREGQLLRGETDGQEFVPLRPAQSRYAPILLPPVSFDDKVYFLTDDRKLLVFSDPKGDLEGLTVEIPGPVISSPIVIQNQLVLETVFDGFYLFDSNEKRVTEPLFPESSRARHFFETPNDIYVFSRTGIWSYGTIYDEAKALRTGRDNVSEVRSLRLSSMGTPVLFGNRVVVPAGRLVLSGPGTLDQQFRDLELADRGAGDEALRTALEGLDAGILAF